MDFYSLAERLLADSYSRRAGLAQILDQIEERSLEGKIAFYPSGRFTRLILTQIRETKPRLLEKVYGCFDKSEEATTLEGLHVFPLNHLGEIHSKLSVLVVASNNFYAKELDDLTPLGIPAERMILTSFYDHSYPEAMETAEFITRFNAVYTSLADAESKSTYLLVWLSRILNDRSMTSVFSNPGAEIEFLESNGFRGYLLENIEPTCLRELFHDIYFMEHVAPKIGDHVFDIGAYRGDTALSFAMRVGPTGKIYCFEPIRANYEWLVKNIRRNRLENVIIPHHLGCSRRSENATMISSKGGAPWAFLDSGETGERVSLTSIDEFVRSHEITRLDFMKLDVEGLEKECLMGAVETVRSLRPKLAIPLYHRTADLLEIPLLLAGWGGYKLYLRCKIDGAYGINLYCAPDPDLH